MTTPVDDLHVKQWIAIVNVRDDDEDQPEFSPFGFSYKQKPAFDGCPLQIIAISLPYIAVQAGRHRFSIDMRKYDVKLLHRTYVKKMHRYFDRDHGIVDVCEVEAEDEQKKTTGGGQGCCPMCGDRLVERRVGNGIWIHACRECGFQGGRPPEQEIGE